MYVRDLCSFVTDLLDKYSEQQLLDFHDGKIPEDQIGVKIGGDHGGDSFKLCLQIVNVKSPNSRHNTFMVTMFNGKDTAEKSSESSVALSPSSVQTEETKVDGEMHESVFIR